MPIASAINFWAYENSSTRGGSPVNAHPSLQGSRPDRRLPSIVSSHPSRQSDCSATEELRISRSILGPGNPAERTYPTSQMASLDFCNERQVVAMIPSPIRLLARLMPGRQQAALPVKAATSVWPARWPHCR